MHDHNIICIPSQARNEHEPFLTCMITGDEKWITYKKIVRKKACYEPGQPRLSNSKQSLSKRMLYIWQDIQGPIQTFKTQTKSSIWWNTISKWMSKKITSRTEASNFQKETNHIALQQCQTTCIFGDLPGKLLDRLGNYWASTLLPGPCIFRFSLIALFVKCFDAKKKKKMKKMLK